MSAPKISHFKFEDLVREKQEARERDEARLRSGEISVHDLQRRNGLFSAFDPARMKISRRRIRVKIG
ncbi:hypothetical protein GCM10007874_09870 [Labrys miyagiensis]|uniref:Uncharacterized protein n=1 Tax=Labrys miyagiensis TaxID=346912 RepID=A0ABQ6CCJ3_9HYPH|nr:hypothetical protein [Labrys miyagiensis]GLS17971.1 hypothetical protein GCM10007874_09870 [Labrys miyagiensis]